MANLTSEEKVDRFLKEELCYYQGELCKQLNTLKSSVLFLAFIIFLYLLVLGLRWLVVYLESYLLSRRSSTAQANIFRDAFRGTFALKHGKRSNKSSAEEKSRNTEILLGNVPGRSNP